MFPEGVRFEHKMPQQVMIRKALAEGYAIPAFNFSDIWELLAIVDAAKEEHAHVYVASNMKVIASMGYGFAAAMGLEAGRETEGNIALHLDHCNSVEQCCAAVDAGYNSVMIDASVKSLDENIEMSKRVAEYAHSRGCLVEAELGRIQGNTMEGRYDGGEFLADTQECIRLVTETGVDSLAVGIGNAHGFYKAPPRLNIERLKEIHSRVSVPLVLHGGTGIPDEQIRQCIENGIAKVNVGTLLHSTYLDTLKKELSRDWDGYGIMDRFAAVRDAVKEKCIRWIRLCGSDQRY